MTAAMEAALAKAMAAMEPFKEAYENNPTFEQMLASISAIDFLRLAKIYAALSALKPVAGI